MRHHIAGRTTHLISDQKRLACLKLKMTINPDPGEQSLCFAVLERAVKDIGLSNRNNSEHFFAYPIILPEICEDLDIDLSVIYRILKQYGLWPYPQPRMVR